MGLSPVSEFVARFTLKVTQLIETELCYVSWDTFVQNDSGTRGVILKKNTMCILTHLGPDYAKVIVPSLGDSFFVLRTFIRHL